MPHELVSTTSVPSALDTDDSDDGGDEPTVSSQTQNHHQMSSSMTNSVRSATPPSIEQNSFQNATAEEDATYHQANSSTTATSDTACPESEQTSGSPNPVTDSGSTVEPVNLHTSISDRPPKDVILSPSPLKTKQCSVSGGDEIGEEAIDVMDSSNEEGQSTNDVDSRSCIDPEGTSPANCRHDRKVSGSSILGSEIGEPTDGAVDELTEVKALLENSSLLPQDSKILVREESSWSLEDSEQKEDAPEGHSVTAPNNDITVYNNATATSVNDNNNKDSISIIHNVDIVDIVANEEKHQEEIAPEESGSKSSVDRPQLFPIKRQSPQTSAPMPVNMVSSPTNDVPLSVGSPSMRSSPEDRTPHEVSVVQPVSFAASPIDKERSFGGDMDLMNNLQHLPHMHPQNHHPMMPPVALHATQPYGYQMHHPSMASAPAMHHAMSPPSMHHQIHHQPHHQMSHQPNMALDTNTGGKRKIYLRLVEDLPPSARSGKRASLFNSFRRRHSRGSSFSSSLGSMDNGMETSGNDRGKMTVSWYPGTTSLELQEHVRNSVIRKLNIGGTVKLDDIRVIDDSMDPPEEIVLCPYIPDGSSFLLRFVTKDAGGDPTPVGSFRRMNGGPPDSPSAAPSPHPLANDLGGLGLNANQLALLGARLKALQLLQPKDWTADNKISQSNDQDTTSTPLAVPDISLKSRYFKFGEKANVETEDDEKSKESEMIETNSLHPADPIETRLQQITELLLAERTRYVPRQEKRRAVFVLANYFVLFLSLIAISAEIQARAPGWHKSLERSFERVQNCATDQDALFECISHGDFAGLIASVVLWLSKSAATKTIFLFGFATPHELWTAVYESLVTAFCSGFSYIFIRRGMNPDTSRNFLHKYWKDAVYGSLAGFNAAFMKQVLKNLIPQEDNEDALQDRLLKILSWLPS